MYIAGLPRYAKCIIAGGTNDTGGILQAPTINLPMVVDGKCPQPKAS